VSSSVKQFLREADHRVARFANTRRVLIEARTPVYLAILGPLLDAFRRDSRISVVVTGGDSPAVRETLEARLTGSHRSVAKRITWMDHGEAEWTRFDLLINADPWGTVTLRRCRHRINFFHGVAGKYDLDCPSGLPAGFNTYSRVAFANADRITDTLTPASSLTRRRFSSVIPSSTRWSTARLSLRTCAGPLGSILPDRRRCSARRGHRRQPYTSPAKQSSRR